MVINNNTKKVLSSAHAIGKKDAYSTFLQDQLQLRMRDATESIVEY
jgi:hypothetical protein